MCDLISIIIPVYNGEARLANTLDSVINQTYDKLEIVVVDDGSNDRTAEICDFYKGRYPDKIIVKHIENSGVSVARNTGLELAKGAYIGWCDGDDYMDPNMIARLYGKIKEYDADIVNEYYRLVKGDQETLPTMRDGDVVYEGASHIRVFDNFFEKQHRGMTTVLWNKLFKREVFDGMRFKPGVTYEDKLIMHHLLDRASKIVYTSSWGYTYFISDDGITSTRSFKTAQGDYEAAFDRFEFLLNKNDEKLNTLVTYDFLNQIVFFHKECKSNGENEIAKDVRKKFRQIFGTSWKRLDNKRTKENIKFCLFELGII